MSIIQLHGIKKAFLPLGGEVEEVVLKGVDLEIQKGEFVAIVGPSGSGKTTLLNIIGLMDRPSDGKLNLMGTSVNFEDEDSLDQMRRQKMGFVFQSFNLLGALTCLENIELNLLGRDLTRDEVRQKALSALDQVEMRDHSHKFPYQMSGGQKQRVALARAFVHQPSLIVADEPTASLDQKNAERVASLLLEMKKSFGTTVVMASHDEKVFKFADRILKIKEGQIQNA